MKKVVGILIAVATISAPGADHSDSLRISPTYPTVYDSIIFTFIDPHACCVTEYHNKYIDVSGDKITVYYSFDNYQCHSAFCTNEPNWVSATSYHVPTGDYSIYAVASPYCAEEPCPEPSLSPRYLGEMTVFDPPIINGSLIVLPPKPTLEDSITIKTLDPFGCCLTEYSYINLAPSFNAGDLVFTYTYDSSGCGLVDCASGSNWLSQSTGPKPVGKHCVFRIATDANAEGNGLRAPEKLGCFTVDAPVSVTIKKLRPACLSGNHSPDVQIRVFNTVGRIVRTLSLLQTDTVKSNLVHATEGLPNGTYVIKITDRRLPGQNHTVKILR
jgi:hypothetical protein